MQKQRVNRVRSALPTGVAALLGSAILAPGLAQAVDFSYSGYIREHLSVNLQDSNEFEPKGFADPFGLTLSGGQQDGQGELSMWRHSGKLEAALDFGPFQIAGVGRIARETRTSYERGLQNTSKLQPALVTFGAGGDAVVGPLLGLPAGALVDAQGFANASAFSSDTMNFLLGTPGCVPVCAFAPGLPGFGAGTQDDLVLDDYDSTELRELYTTFTLGDRFHFKLGRQQVVWGETDFFRAMDIIHGYDLRWRSFLELENEELRRLLKPQRVQ